MKKIALQFLYFALLSSLMPFYALALDPPHNEVNGYGCDTCHDVYSSNPKLMPDGDVAGPTIDDTIFNVRCWSCHNPSGDAPGPTPLTHSSLTSDEDYGQWTVECWVCHSVHNQQQQGQDIDPGDSEPYGRNIRTEINLSGIIYADASPPKNGRQTVVFKGLNSFTDTDGTGEVTGICQVCHTKTTHWKSDGSLAGVGVHSGMTGSGCMSCHSHGEGFKAACDVCHGFAPGDLVSTPGTTGSTTAGAHLEHTTNQGFSCDACHLENIQNQEHNNGSPLSITIGFGPSGISQGGSYDGQAGVQYDATSTTPLTSVSSGGSKTCTNLYCHGNFAGSGNNASPVWDDPATATCGSCHGSSSGAHNDHITIMSFECSLCHYNTAEGNVLATDTSHHVNYATDWRFDPTDLRTSGADYNSENSGSKSPPNTTYSSCNNLYCHSTAQGTGDPTTPPTYSNPSWSDTLSGCTACHNAGAHRDPPFMDTGSHYAHVQYRFTQPGNCQACHYLDVGGSLCEACHNPHGTIISRVDKHVDGKIDIDFLPSLVGSSAVYNGDNVPRTNYADCDNTYCHSNGTSVSTGSIPSNTTANWGTPGALACTSCHEYSPTYDLYSPKANSHVRHEFLGCEICHYTTTTDGTAIADKRLHVNGQYDVAPSPTFFAHGSDHTNTFTYVYDPGGGTCSSITCHNYWGPADNKKWGGASLNPPSIILNLTDQGDYGVTALIGSPSCLPDSHPDSVICPTPYTYTWDFSDGYSETTAVPTIHYEFGAAGPHTLTLTITAANGLSGSTTTAPFNPNPPPPPTPNYNPQAVLAGNTVTVTVDTSPPNPDIGKIDIWWNWTGSGSSSGDSTYISFPATMQHTYSTSGTYTIKVKVTTNPDRDEYEYEWNTADCSNCTSLQVTVP